MNFRRISGSGHWGVRRRDLVDLIVLALIWGASFLFIKVGLRDFSPANVVFIRLLLGTATLALIVVLGQFSLAGWRQALPVLLVIGATGSALPFILITYGEVHISSSLAAILNASTPFFAAPLAHAFLGSQDRLSASKLLGMGVGFVGVAVLLGVGTASLAGASALGSAAVLLASLSYAGNLVIVRARLHGAPPMLAPLGQTVSASIMLAPFGLTTLPRHGLHLSPLLSVLGLGVLGTGIAYLLYFRLLRQVGPTRTSMVTYLLPCTALIYGVVLLGEPATANILAGLILVLLGIGLTLEMIRMPSRLRLLWLTPQPGPPPRAGEESDG